MSLIGLLAILLWPSHLQGGQTQLPCSDQGNLVTDSKGAIVVLSSKEMDRQAIHKVKPRFPISCRCSGTVTAYLRISPNGEVECSKVINGHPLLRAAVADAVKQWVFKPSQAGDTKSRLGRLIFRFSVDGKVEFQ
jgi:outer membrane biosynthesis protein TonB